MGIEIAANRLFAPYLSSSQVVLTIIIGIIMIAMAIGNIIGGKISDKTNDVSVVFILIAISGIYTCIIPFIGKYVIALFAGIFALTVSKGLIIYTTVFSCLVLLAPPLMLLGVVTPSLIKFSMGEKSSGKIIGLLEALNTIGSIIGTFLPTFITIPFIGTPYSFILFGGLLIIISSIYLIIDVITVNKITNTLPQQTEDINLFNNNNEYNKQKNKSFKRKKILNSSIKKQIKEIVIIIISIIIVVVSSILGVFTKFSFGNDKSIKFETESMYNYIKVTETNDTYYLSTNILFGVQSMMKKDKSLTGMYYDSCLLAPLMSNINNKTSFDCLILGNGSGTYATMLYEYYKNTDLNITGIEIDQKIIDLSYEYFQMPNSVNVICDDGRSYLNRDNNKYDLIMVDAYSSISAPFQMTTYEFFNSVYNHLKEDGIMVMNINMVSKTSDELNNSLCDTVESVFESLIKYNVPYNTNLVIYASQSNNLINDLENQASIKIDERLLDIKNDVILNSYSHIFTNNILYDSSADVEVKSINAIDGIIEQELEFYKDYYHKNGLLELIKYLLQ
ncbi:MAG: fused MFS/spermidine synthase [Clostridia bacterium]|nr:fused MFS/spermidine synthase [Clostridia bacterium]